ncbi:acyl carrier protein [Embleya sp. NPDC020886]|uniref:acyl carrier protein n=1 Tax=Embleya sp. NPDC020886 TaxID=3363980 RepID=UPI00379ECEE0
MTTTEKAVIAAAANLAWVSVRDITGATNLEADLGFDSIQKAELLFNLEGEHGVVLTTRNDLDTIGDITAAIDAAHPIRLRDLDFYAGVATRRAVFEGGPGIDSGPTDWEAALGADHLDDVAGEGLLRRDYGLLEIDFSRDSRGRMACFGFGVEIHRLAHRPSAEAVPPSLSRRYGTFAPRMAFEELRVAVQDLGYRIELEDEAPDMHRYRVPGSGTRIHVIADTDPYGSGLDPDEPIDPDDPRVGDLWSLSVSPSRWGPE